MARENTDLQISALTRLWRRQLAASPATITAAEILGYASGAAAVMVDGSEIIRVTFNDGGADSIVMYPKEVVMTAALDVLDGIDAGEDSAAESTVTHFNLAGGRIET